MTPALRLVAVAVLALVDAPPAPPVATRELLRTSTTWNGAPIAYPAAARPEVQAVAVDIAPGAATAWHAHPVNNFAYVLEGTLRLELEDGTTHLFHAGEAFAEVVNTWHRGVNAGAGPVKLVVFYTGEVGKPISTPRPGAKPAGH